MTSSWDGRETAVGRLDVVPSQRLSGDRRQARTVVWGAREASQSLDDLPQLPDRAHGVGRPCGAIAVWGSPPGPRADPIGGSRPAGEIINLSPYVTHRTPTAGKTRTASIPSASARNSAGAVRLRVLPFSGGRARNRRGVALWKPSRRRQPGAATLTIADHVGRPEVPHPATSGWTSNARPAGTPGNAGRARGVNATRDSLGSGRERGSPMRSAEAARPGSRRGKRSGGPCEGRRALRGFRRKKLTLQAYSFAAPASPDGGRAAVRRVTATPASVPNRTPYRVAHRRSWARDRWPTSPLRSAGWLRSHVFGRAAREEVGPGRPLVRASVARGASGYDERSGGAGVSLRDRRAGPKGRPRRLDLRRMTRTALLRGAARTAPR